jgi:hypothetical protein
LCSNLSAYAVPIQDKGYRYEGAASYTKSTKDALTIVGIPLKKRELMGSKKRCGSDLQQWD